jgi:hypothetical protein
VPERLFSLLGPLDPNLPSRQFVGLPPELTEGEDLRRPLPAPDVLLIEARADGVFLERFTVNSAFGGDTWHETVEDAKRQAVFEYAEAVGEWHDVPDTVGDAAEYAVEEARRARLERA